MTDRLYDLDESPHRHVFGTGIEDRLSVHGPVAGIHDKELILALMVRVIQLERRICGYEAMYESWVRERNDGGSND